LSQLSLSADTLYSSSPRTALSLRIWGYVTSSPSLSALSCSGPNKQLHATFTDLKKGLPTFLQLHVWYLVQNTQEADLCICRNFAPQVHRLYFYLLSALTNGASWRTVKDTNLCDPTASRTAWQSTLLSTLHPEKLQRKLVSIQWLETGCVDLTGQGGLDARCWCNSPAEWSSSSKYRDEEVLLQVRASSSGQKSNSLISKAYAVLFHSMGVMDLEPSEPPQIPHSGTSRWWFSVQSSSWRPTEHILHPRGDSAVCDAGCQNTLVMFLVYGLELEFQIV